LSSYFRIHGTSLNVSGLNTESMFMAKCCKRKIIRKSAEIAMANFLPIEELRIPLIFWLIFMHCNLS